MNHYEEHAVWVLMTKFADYTSVHGVYLTKKSAEKDLKKIVTDDIEAWIEPHEVIA